MFALQVETKGEVSCVVEGEGRNFVACNEGIQMAMLACNRGLGLCDLGHALNLV